MCGTLGMADVSRPVEISVLTDFEDHTTFTPHDRHIGALNKTLDQLVSWSVALAPLRAGSKTAFAGS